jgi:hypothetical protein
VARNRPHRCQHALILDPAIGHVALNHALAVRPSLCERGVARRGGRRLRRGFLAGRAGADALAAVALPAAGQRPERR